jgi:hypothetical protein
MARPLPGAVLFPAGEDAGVESGHEAVAVAFPGFVDRVRGLNPALLASPSRLAAAVEDANASAAGAAISTGAVYRVVTIGSAGSRCPDVAASNSLNRLSGSN